MKYNRILFIINPISGDADKSHLDKMIANFCVAHHIQYRIIKTTGSNDAKRIETGVAEFSPEIVVAGGGDGTIKLVAQELVNSKIKLAILPLGSANGLARELGITGDSAESLHLLLNQKVRTIDAIRLNGELCLHLSDMGFNAELIQEFENGKTRGMLGYARVFFEKIAGRKKRWFSIDIDGHSHTFEAEMVVIANASSYGTGAVINPKCNLEDGLLEVCVFKPLSWHQLLHLSWHSFIGNPENSEYLEIYQGKLAHLRTKKPLILQVDGEVVGEFTEIEARSIPAALQIIVP